MHEVPHRRATRCGYKRNGRDTHGVIRFDPWGRCTIEATATTLALRVEATGEDGLRQIQDVIASDLGRFGRRDHLSVNWQTEAPGAAGGDPKV
jgi:hypothetical protein